MIMNYIKMQPEELDLKLEEEIRKNETYNKTSKDLYELLSSIEKKMALKIEATAVCLETISRDIAYNEGFKDAINFILLCRR